MTSLPTRERAALLATVLLAAILFVDALWWALVGPTGTVAYGLIDEPAHLATCVIALLAVAAASSGRPPLAFTTAALAASVAIDVDHVPGMLGSHAMTGSLPRPYAHSMLLVGALLAAGWAARRRDHRAVAAGLAFGVSAHLLRDLATGPGVSLLWPLSGSPIRVPYEVYAVALLMSLAAFLPRRATLLARGSVGLLAVLALSAALVAPQASAHKIAMGVYLRGTDDSPGLLDQYARQVGRSPAIVASYKRWDVRPFYAPELREIAGRGAIPMVSWEPWNEQGHGYRLGAIARGRFDGFVRSAAREAKHWGGPILLRFGQEMNGSWAPWQRGQNGTTGRSFVAAWRHLVRIFRQVGADNVRWVWCPYIDNGDLPFWRFYPGGRWVDWVALDGFNWGAPIAWQSFSKIFDRSYRKLTRATNKPIMIAEIGSNEAGGSKARWLRKALRRQLPRLKRVYAVVWFSAIDRSDFRVDSSPGALAAFRAGLRLRKYGGGRRLLMRAGR